MKRKLLLIVFVFAISTLTGIAQIRELTGKVTSAEDGSPIPGVAVIVKGTTLGQTTDMDGKFRLKVPQDTKTLVFSFVGLKTQEVEIGDQTTINVKMKSENIAVDEVVVTALGIQRQKRELGYSTTEVKTDELTQAKSMSVATSLQGKVAGLNISSLNSGVLENVKINLRGIRSLTGNNNPMLLLDGVPVRLDILNTINPNDVENINVLKGTSAAAIYGPDARNGVIIVTTKGGSKDQKPDITISNTTQFSSVSFFPKFQTQFGSGGYGSYIPYENWSWGPEFDGSDVQLGETLENGDKQIIKYSAIKNNRKKFFNTGIVMQNDISYAAKNFYLSVQDAKNKGVVPNDENRRTGIRLNVTQDYKKFSLTLNTNYIYQKYDVFDNNSMGNYNSANNVGLNGGLMNLIFNTQADVPLTSYKDLKNNEFATFNNYYNRYGINPYLALDTWREKSVNQNLITSLDLKFAVTDWLDLNYRAAMTLQSIVTRNTTKQVTANSYGLARSFSSIPQSVKDSTSVANRFSSEFFANFHKKVGDFKVEALAGTYVREVSSRATSVNASNLVIPDLFNVSTRPGELHGSSTETKVRLFSLYGLVSLNYKNFANIEVTGRNDKTSVLDPSNNSYFYPGVSASFVLTDAIPILKSEKFNFMKLRVSWNKTGNADINPYLLSATFSQGNGFPFNGLPGYSADNNAYDKYLKPEFIESKEFGFETSLFKSRLNIDATYYTQDNTNQIVNIRVPRSTGYTFAYVNAASFRNYGFETQVKLTPLLNIGKVKLNFTANYSYNNSEVKSIYGDLQELSIGGYVMCGNQAVVGKPAFVFNASDYKRDKEGHVIVDGKTGIPIIDEVNKKFGRTLPLHIIGLNPTLEWKGLTVSALFEYKGGHYAFNLIGNEMAWTGVSAITGENHRERFIIPNSVYEDPKKPGTYIKNTNITIYDVNEFFTGDNYRTVASNFITSAASWRFRELSITYEIPHSLISKQNLVKGITVGFVGRNLALWVPKSNVYSDPDFRGNNDFLTSGTGNITGIVNATVNPPTRTLGGTLSVKF